MSAEKFVEVWKYESKEKDVSKQADTCIGILRHRLESQPGRKKSILKMLYSKEENFFFFPTSDEKGTIRGRVQTSDEKRRSNAAKKVAEFIWTLINKASSDKGFFANINNVITLGVKCVRTLYESKNPAKHPVFGNNGHRLYSMLHSLCDYRGLHFSNHKQQIVDHFSNNNEPLLAKYASRYFGWHA